MCIAQKRPITKENLEGLLTNLEEALEEIFESGVDETQWGDRRQLQFGGDIAPDAVFLP